MWIPIVKNPPSKKVALICPFKELPYGEQVQVDFGEYNIRIADGKRKKVRFFAMVLSRSRMKYVYFSHKPFTSQTIIYAHERAFEFFGSIPKTLEQNFNIIRNSRCEIF